MTAVQIYDGFMTTCSPQTTTQYLFSDIYSIYISAGGHRQLRILAWLFDTLLRWSYATLVLERGSDVILVKRLGVRKI